MSVVERLSVLLPRVLSEDEDRSTETPEEKPEMKINCNEAEANIVSLVLSNILRWVKLSNT